jgi:hypothetical protein
MIILGRGFSVAFYEKEIAKIGRKKLSLSWGKYSYKLWVDCVHFKKNFKKEKICQITTS